MAEKNFEEALSRVLAHEGGYGDNPSDPGGPTNFGITIADYRKFVKPDATAADVRSMKIADAKKIYRTQYWQAMRCGELPDGVDYAVFDYGVNSGVGRAGKVLRRLLKLPSLSSIIDAAVVEASRNVSPGTLISSICDERLAFLQSLKTWPTFGKGWSRRVSEVRTAALAMANAADAPASTTTARLKTVAAAGTVVAAGGAAHYAASANASLAVAALVFILALVAGWLAWRHFKKV